MEKAAKSLDKIRKKTKYLKPEIKIYSVEDIAKSWNFEIFGQNPASISFECDPV